jgi:hypothetical protein
VAWFSRNHTIRKVRREGRDGEKDGRGRRERYSRNIWKEMKYTVGEIEIEREI